MKFFKQLQNLFIFLEYFFIGSLSGKWFTLDHSVQDFSVIRNCFFPEAFPVCQALSVIIQCFCKIIKHLFHCAVPVDLTNAAVKLIVLLLQENTPLQACEPGDTLAVLATGAYNYSMASNYNRLPRPAVVMTKDGKARVVVRAETYEDLIDRDE